VRTSAGDKQDGDAQAKFNQEVKWLLL
jgi:hypothetical protein